MNQRKISVGRKRKNHSRTKPNVDIRGGLDPKPGSQQTINRTLRFRDTRCTITGACTNSFLGSWYAKRNTATRKLIG